MPDDLYERLRSEAHESRRSINAAVIDILDGELRDRQQLPLSELLHRARPVRARTRADGQTTVAEDIRADRER